MERFVNFREFVQADICYAFERLQRGLGEGSKYKWSDVLIRQQDLLRQVAMHARTLVSTQKVDCLQFCMRQIPFRECHSKWKPAVVNATKLR